jgi:hypothetical protein
MPLRENATCPSAAELARRLRQLGSLAHPAMPPRSSCSWTSTARSWTPSTWRALQALRPTAPHGACSACRSNSLSPPGPHPTTVSGRCTARNSTSHTRRVMAWVAFDRAIKAAARTPREGPVQRWRELRRRIHAEFASESTTRCARPSCSTTGRRARTRREPTSLRDESPRRRQQAHVPTRPVRGLGTPD